MFPGNIPGKAQPGVNIDKGRGSFIDKAYRSGATGNIVDEFAPAAASDPSKFTAFTKAVTNPQGIPHRNKINRYFTNFKR